MHPGTLRRHLKALGLMVPALAATLAFQLDLPFSTMLFTGGVKVLLTNLALVILFPYFGVFLLALGKLLLPAPPAVTSSRLTDFDVRLIQFFGGAAILVMTGFALGLATLLYWWVTAPIFCAVLYVYFLRSPGIFYQALAWIIGRPANSEESAELDPVVRDVSAALRVLTLLFVLFILLTRGILIDVNTSDNIQLYFPYLAEVRLQHSIWLDPSHPVYSDFLIGRGNGAHLFFSSFTNQFIGQIISVVYLVSIIFVIHRVVSLIIPDEPRAPLWVTARRILPDCAMFLALCSPIVEMDSAKYHLQTGAFITFLSWSGLLFLFYDRDSAKWLFRVMLPVAIAVPLMLPQYQAFATVVLAVSALAIFMDRGMVWAKFDLYLIVIGLIATVGSLLFNQLYIGIGELNPPFLFLKFANLEKLRHWTSVELIQYLSLTQSLPLSAAIHGSAAELMEKRIWFRLMYVAVLFYPTFLLLKRGAHILLCAVERKGLNPVVLLFTGIFLIYYLVSWWVPTSYPSVTRLLQFRFVYGPAALFIAVAVCIVLLEPETRGAGAGENKWLTPLVALITVLVLIDVSFRTVIIALVIAVCLLSKRLREWPSSPVFGQTIAPIGTAIDKAWARRFRYWPVIMLVIALGTVLSGVFHFDAYNTKWSRETTGGAVESRAAHFFLGTEGLIKSVRKDGNKFDPWGWSKPFNFARCGEIEEAVPGNARVLPLNAYYNIVPCHNSSLLPRNKIVHHYESTLAPYFDDVTFGDPEHAAEIYRKLGINYFYVEKGDINFFGPGFGKIFSRDSLEKRFDVYRDTPGFLILTWRGKGATPVSPEMAAYIDRLREESCHNATLYIDNCAGLVRLKEWRERQGKK